MAEGQGGDSSAPTLSANAFGHLLTRALAADLVTTDQSRDLQRMMASWQQRLSSRSSGSRSARISELTVSLDEGVEMSPTGSRASSEGVRRHLVGQPSDAVPNVAFVTDVEGNWEYFVNYVNMSEALSFTDEPIAADGTVCSCCHLSCRECGTPLTLPRTLLLRP